MGYSLVIHQMLSRPIGAAAVALALLAVFAASADASTAFDEQTITPVCDPAYLRDLTARADRGDVEAQFEEGLLLLAGHCRAADHRIGLARLKSAAERGHAEAAYSLGQLYGDPSLALFDALQARRYLRIAAAQGHTQAQHSLGLMLIRGDGGMARTDSGLYWLGAAASEGHGLSAMLMGRLHELGRFGVVKDLCLAHDWYEAGLLLGEQNAQAQMQRVSQGGDCF